RRRPRARPRHAVPAARARRCGRRARPAGRAAAQPALAGLTAPASSAGLVPACAGRRARGPPARRPAAQVRSTPGSAGDRGAAAPARGARGGPRRDAMRTLALLALGVAVPAALAAQPPSLDQAEQLIARGEYAAARVLLERWWREEPAANATIVPTARPRALLLRARLATDPAAAEQHYLALT